MNKEFYFNCSVLIFTLQRKMSLKKTDFSTAEMRIKRRNSQVLVWLVNSTCSAERGRTHLPRSIVSIFPHPCWFYPYKSLCWGLVLDVSHSLWGPTEGKADYWHRAFIHYLVSIYSFIILSAETHWLICNTHQSNSKNTQVCFWIGTWTPWHANVNKHEALAQSAYSEKPVSIDL